MFIADAHCDTLLGMQTNNVKFESNTLQIDYKRLKKASEQGYLQFFAVFQTPSVTIEEQKTNADNMIELFNGIIEQQNINHILAKSDLKQNGINGLLSIEGLYFLDGNISGFNELYKKGVRCISLTWNPDNDFSGGIMGETGKGLTSKGKKLIRKANDKGVLVDVSHISDNGFWDVAAIMKKQNKPFCATHSNSRRLCSHARNLDDDMLKEIARSNGFVGINMYSCFLSNDCMADIDDVIRHIEYICSLCGADYVGFGSDFDGIDRDKSALSDPIEINKVLEKLLQMNYKEEDVLKIASGNIIRVLGEVLK